MEDEYIVGEHIKWVKGCPNSELVGVIAKITDIRYPTIFLKVIVGNEFYGIGGKIQVSYPIQKYRERISDVQLGIL